jgi:hypothetical protein
MDKRKSSKFPPGAAERGRAIGSRLGGLAVKKLGVGVFAPGMAAKGWKAAGLDRIWDDPVFRESARWRRSPWKSRKES